MRKLLWLIALCLVSAGLLSAQAADPYKAFNTYRAAAAKGSPYPGAPLKGKVLGFANIFAALPFCVLVENGIKRQLVLAGGDLGQGWISMDNRYDPAVARENMDSMLSRHPDIFIEYQSDPKLNSMIAAAFAAAGIPVLAVDVPIPGAPLVGTNNYTVSVMAGHAMARLIREKWGGWDAADLVVILKAPAGGEHMMLRTEGVADALAEEFGIDAADPKILRSVGGMGQLEQAKAAMAEVLASHPEAVKIALASINEQIMAGCIAAMKEAGRWDRDNTVVVTMGADALGQSQVRDGLSDAAVAFFPEHYGDYIVPAVAALLTGNAVPPSIFVKNEVITGANIDRWYPGK